MTAISSGDIVDITIKGVRIADMRPDGTVVINCEDDRVHGVWPMPPQAAVKRAEPRNPIDAATLQEQISNALRALDGMEMEGHIEPYVAATVRKKLGLPPRHWPLWFAREHAAKPDDPDRTSKIEMASVAGDRDSLTPPAFLNHAVEITLVYRPEDGTQ